MITNTLIVYVALRVRIAFEE